MNPKNVHWQFASLMTNRIPLKSKTRLFIPPISLLVILLIHLDCLGQDIKGFEPTFKESESTTHPIPEGQEYTFGYLAVPENRADPNSQIIQIPVYIFKSRSANPKPDPIIYTVGGPGATTMPSARYMNYYEYLDDRDFILLEQRGNYYAKPHLDCPEWSKALNTTNRPGFNPEKSEALLAEAAKACRARLRGKGIDLNGYTTHEIAADINDLVKALGIAQYNLLTISYSTKIAQVLMRDYPERIRSVVMDSPLPLEVRYDEESVQNLLQTVNSLLEDCEADKACNSAFPNLRTRFFEFLADKTRNPLEVSIENPESGKMETFYLKGADLIAVFTSASTGEVGSIPFEINKLLKGDTSSLKEQLSSVFEAPGNGAGLGMRLSVWCAEENPFNSPGTVEAETTKYPEVKGLSPAVFEDEICNIWKVKKVAEIENHPVKSDIPVLLISGEFDSETPVKWAESMKDNLENSYHLIFKGWKHTPTTNWGNPCAMQAANAFFQRPFDKPVPECLEQLKGPEYKIE
jgi:pimeloyl-ACP methyl ester carboxylesterase